MRVMRASAGEPLARISAAATRPDRATEDRNAELVIVLIGTSGAENTRSGAGGDSELPFRSIRSRPVLFMTVRNAGVRERSTRLWRQRAQRVQHQVDLARGDLGGVGRGRQQDRRLDDAVAAFVEIDDALDRAAPGGDLLEVVEQRRIEVGESGA